MDKQRTREKINDLKERRGAVILAHNYQIGEVQDVADYVGDSFELSRIAAGVQAETIVFCGVHFMAESAAILAPGKTVLLPESLAGCPLADMITADSLREVKKKYPGVPVATYVNTSAAVKAESDICVTSSNALAVIDLLEGDRVIFAPDRNLGHYIAARTSKEIIPWDGYCITHQRVTADDIERARAHYPDALIMVHPECPPEVTGMADEVLSTGGMIKMASRTSHSRIVLGTEMGLLYRLQKENPDKQFLLLSPGLVCPNMKYTTLEKVVRSLEKMETVVTVPEEIREKAAQALERMLEVVV